MLKHLASVRANQVATTVITMYEQLRGRLASVNRRQDDYTLQEAYLRLRATQAYYCVIHVLHFDDAALAKYHELLGQKIRIGTQDLRIAAITLTHSAILVTGNRRHFDQVPGLQVQDWRRPDNTDAI